MAEQDENDRSESDRALEQEIRRGRKFSLNDALGRMAGQGMMKGGSPVSPQQQAELEIGLYLRNSLSDAGGVLAVVLTRRIKCSDLLLENPARPLAVLSTYVAQLVASTDLLKELVREADVEWGRVVGERPHFERAQHPPHPDDPYTLASVRAELMRLLETLSRDGIR